MEPPRVWGVCLVSFDHPIGPTVEFAWPPALKDNDELNGTLPFLALPDGAHTVRPFHFPFRAVRTCRAARAGTDRESAPARRGLLLLPPPPTISLEGLHLWHLV